MSSSVGWQMRSGVLSIWARISNIAGYWTILLSLKIRSQRDKWHLSNAIIVTNFSNRTIWYPVLPPKCAKDLFKAWLSINYTIPTARVCVTKNKKTVKDFYKCHICGFKHGNRLNVITHLSHHEHQHLKRFNLDVIMSHTPAKMIAHGDYRCIVDPTVSFKASDFGHHACIEPNCGNLLPRLIYRLNEYNERATYRFKGDAYENEDNEELILLLKEKMGKVVQ